MLNLLPNGLRSFERCPRCAKPWVDYSIFCCRNCESMFGACCEEEQAYGRELHWLAAVCRETRIKKCPVCTAAIDYEDIIGVIVER
jgi:hypothetical protein